MKNILFLIFISLELLAQSYSIQGIVKDSETKIPLSSANIFIKELQYGITTDNTGKFKFTELLKGNYLLQFSYVGYETEYINISLIEERNLKILLTEVPVELSTALILGTRPKFRETAVAFSEISENEIKRKNGGREAVNILESLPSTFISNQGGGIGEQRLSLRGFDQQNIAILINGIPINNPENGEVYWSNWAGITDILEYVTIQRGLSAIPYSTSSIGGSVNFVTKNLTNSNHSIILSSDFGSDNLIKNSVSFSTSFSENTNLSGFISKRNLHGYADQVYSDEYTYFLSFNILFIKQS